MQFNENLKNSVIAKFNSAIKQINNCKAVHIDIPADFAKAENIRSALDKIKSAHLEFIKSEFERAVNDAENADKKTMENVLGFEFASNEFGFFNQGVKKDNHDLYHQIKDNKTLEPFSKGFFNSLINRGIDFINLGIRTDEQIMDDMILRSLPLQEKALSLYLLISNNKKDRKKQVKQYRENTMAFVAENQTETLFNQYFKKYYKNTNGNLPKSIKTESHTASSFFAFGPFWLIISRAGGFEEEYLQYISKDSKDSGYTEKDLKNAIKYANKNDDVFSFNNNKRIQSLSQIDLLYKLNEYDEKLYLGIKNDILNGNIPLDCANSDKFISLYARKNNYSKNDIKKWVLEHQNISGEYGIDQGIYKHHILYVTEDSNVCKKGSDEYYEALENNRIKSVTYDSYFVSSASKLAERYNLDFQEAVDILEIMDTPRGMCSFSSSAEALAYQYAKNPKVFEKEFGFPLYNLAGGINEELYVDSFIYTNGYKENKVDTVFQKDNSINPNWVKKNEYGVDSLARHYPESLALIYKDDQANLKEYFHDRNEYDKIIIKNQYERYENIINKHVTLGNLGKVVDAINKGDSVVLTIIPMNDLGLTFTRLSDNATVSCNGGHQVNVLSIEGEDIIISTWGNIYKINVKELKSNCNDFRFSSIEIK